MNKSAAMGNSPFAVLRPQPCTGTVFNVQVSFLLSF